MSRKPRNKRPLDQTALRDLALNYVARFSTTEAKLANYLRRKIQERGFAEDAGEADIQAVVRRLAELRYIDDAAYAQARSAGLLRKGYGARRVDQTLRGDGIDEHTRNELQPNTAQARQSAQRLAQKRGFGPFNRNIETHGQLDKAAKEKQIAAMVRAGHDFGAARFVIEAANVEEIDQWIREAEEWHDED